MSSQKVIHISQLVLNRLAKLTNNRTIFLKCVRKLNQKYGVIIDGKFPIHGPNYIYTIYEKYLMNEINYSKFLKKLFKDCDYCYTMDEYFLNLFNKMQD